MLLHLVLQKKGRRGVNVGVIFVVKSHLFFHLFFRFKLTLHTCTCEYLHLHLVQLQEKEGGREGVLTRGDVSCESPPAAPISLLCTQNNCSATCSLHRNFELM